MDKKFIWIGVAIVIVGAFLVWLFIESSKPLPGQKQSDNCDNYIDFSKIPELNQAEDKCRAHVGVGSPVNYPTNPPTHGPHYEEWTRAGVYTEPKNDGNMVHSLEHGYVIMHYRCNLGGSQEASASAIATPSGKLDTQAECDQRKSELEKIYEKKGKRKLIVVARPNLDTNFALTAWSYLDKFDDFDSGRIEKFIDAHRDNGPERTME